MFLFTEFNVKHHIQTQVVLWINVRENRRGMENPEILVTLGTQDRTKTNKTKKHNTENKK